MPGQTLAGKRVNEKKKVKTSLNYSDFIDPKGKANKKVHLVSLLKELSKHNMFYNKSKTSLSFS